MAGVPSLNFGGLNDWWLRTRASAWLGAALCLFIGIGLLVLAMKASLPAILGIPGNLFVATLIVPGALVALVLASTGLQDRTARNTRKSGRF